MIRTIKLDIRPIPKVRMVKSDKWKKRPSVLKYWNYAESIRVLLLQQDIKELPMDFQIIFNFKNPRKRSPPIPHTKKPDLDNLFKAFTDILFGEDAMIYKIQAEKWYNKEDCIIIFYDETLPMYNIQKPRLR